MKLKTKPLSIIMTKQQSCFDFSKADRLQKFQLNRRFSLKLFNIHYIFCHFFFCFLLCCCCYRSFIFEIIRVSNDITNHNITHFSSHFFSANQFVHWILIPSGQTLSLSFLLVATEWRCIHKLYLCIQIFCTYYLVNVYSNA